MRRFSLCLFVLASAALLGGAGQRAPQRLYQAYSDAEKADLDKVSAYLNGMKSLKANFIQLGPDGGMAQGDANPRQQFSNAKGLGQVVVGSGVEGPHLVVFLAARGQNDDWNL